MRTRVIPVVACGIALWSAVAAYPAGSAQTQIVNDPKGRYTITIPQDWHLPGARGQQDPGVLLLVEGPSSGGAAATVAVQSRSLMHANSPLKFAQDAAGYRQAFFPGITVTQQGEATIAGRPAYFLYFTWMPQGQPALYDLQVYFTDGLNGWIVTGFTERDPQRVQVDFPVIRQIIESFQVISRPR
jgi:hypothetical protein